MATPGFNPSEMQYAHQFAYPGYSLYVNNIDPRLNEPLFLQLLYQFFPNQVLACKFFEEVGCGEPYCFIMFTDPSVASAALSILNGRQVYDKKLRVNWACPPTAIRQPSFSEADGYSIYVGDLGADIDDKTLHQAFQTFGEVRGARIVRDTDTGMSKGYGFVVFASNQDAEEAISKMNGNLLGTRPVKVSWASRNKSGQAPAPLNYNDVYHQASEGNTTIYVGGLPANMDELSCRQFFEPYGQLQEVKFFQDKRFAFIKFDTHEAAATAIVRCNGQMVDGSMVKCWWSKDNSTTQIIGSTNLVPSQQPASGYAPSQNSYYGAQGYGGSYQGGR